MLERLFVIMQLRTTHLPIAYNVLLWAVCHRFNLAMKDFVADYDEIPFVGTYDDEQVEAANSGSRASGL